MLFGSEYSFIMINFVKNATTYAFVVEDACHGRT
jgi:hypothetical protein